MNGMEEKRKVPLSMSDKKFISVNSACCYPVAVGDDVFYAGEIRGEKTTLQAKRIKTQWGDEVEFILLGKYHKEKLGYTRTDPKTWVSWLSICVSKDEILRLIKHLEDITK